MKYLTSKYYLRLIVFSLLISILPVIFIGLFSYNTASHTIQKKVDEENEQLLLQTQLRVEQVLKITDNSTLQLLMYVNGFSLNYSGFSFEKFTIADDYDAINKTITALNGFASQNIKLEDALLVCNSKDYAISTKGYFPLSEISEKKQIQKFDAMPEYFLWSKWDGPLVSSTLNTDNAGSPGVVLVRKMYPLSAKDSNAVIIVKISSAELSKFITNNSESGDIIVLDNEFNIIADKNPDGKNPIANVYAKKIKELNEKSGQFSVNIDNKKVQINYLKSDYNGWVYVSTVPLENVTRDSRRIGLATMLMCFLIIILIILASFQGSKKIYSPINSFYELMLIENKKTRSKDNKDELKYIDENIRKLFRERNQLTNQLVSQNENFREYYLGKLLQGEIKPQGVVQKLQTFGFCTGWKHMCVFAVETDSLEGTPYKEEDLQLTAFAINNIICDLIPEDKRLTPVIINKTCVIVLGDCHDLAAAFDSFIVAQASMMQKKIKECIGINVGIGIGRSYSDFCYINKSYAEAVEALKNKLFFGDGAIICYEDTRILKSSNNLFPQKNEEDTLYAIRFLDVNQACELADIFVKEIFVEKSSYLDYQASLGKFVMDVLQIARDANIPMQKLFSEDKDLFEIMGNLNNQKDITQWLKASIIIPIMKEIEDSRASQYKKISEEVIHMIHSQYDTDLTLDVCAKRLNYNPKHVSRAFKEENGVSFSDYLSNYRLEIAKKLLIETDMKINDIAERLGYQNAQNFIRYFRKMEGITPGQYRDKNE